MISPVRPMDGGWLRRTGDSPFSPPALLGKEGVLMDDKRFDQWTRTLAAGGWSRRNVGRLALGGGLATLGLGLGAETALACRRNKKPCAKGIRHGNCCSGTCRKRKCRPTKGAAGCTVQHDICTGEGATPCPNNPENGACVKLDNGKPFCFQALTCEACTSNADCTFRPNGKCLKTCEFCDPFSDGQACVYPPA